MGTCKETITVTELDGTVSRVRCSLFATHAGDHFSNTWASKFNSQGILSVNEYGDWFVDMRAI